MSDPTFPCEVCGAFHSASEVSNAGGYCPQCDADYDERKMMADLVQRYAALQAELAALREGQQDKKLVEALEQLIGDFDSEIHNEYNGTSMLNDRLAEINYAREALAAWKEQQ